MGIDVILQEMTGGGFDVVIDSAGDIQTADAFDAAILVALFTDARASASEVVDPVRRRGWPGNESTPGIEIGGKLWLYEQARASSETLRGIADAARAALQVMIDAGYALDVTTSTYYTTTNTLQLGCVFMRPNSEVTHRHFDLWADTFTQGS